MLGGNGNVTLTGDAMFDLQAGDRIGFLFLYSHTATITDTNQFSPEHVVAAPGMDNMPYYYSLTPVPRPKLSETGVGYIPVTRKPAKPPLPPRPPQPHTPSRQQQPRQQTEQQTDTASGGRPRQWRRIR
jgi:hypothetical protein